MKREAMDLKRENLLGFPYPDGNLLLADPRDCFHATLTEESPT